MMNNGNINQTWPSQDWSQDIALHFFKKHFLSSRTYFANGRHFVAEVKRRMKTKKMKLTLNTRIGKMNLYET